MTIREFPATDPASVPRAVPGRFALFAVWAVLAEISGLIIWLGAGQPRGMLLLTLDGKLTISYAQRLWPLAALVLCGVGCALVVRNSKLAFHAASLPGLLASRRGAVAALSIALAFTGTILAVWALRAFPNSSDEYDYLFQAWTFLAGRWANPAPPLPDLFAFYNLAVADGKWFSVYPPGWSLLLAGAIAPGLPAWLVCPLLGALLLFITAKLAQRRDGPLGAVLALGLVALSPFFLFNAASYFNLVPATVAGLLFCWAALDFLDRPRFANAAAAGLALGMLGLIRPTDAIVFALPFAAGFLWQARPRHYRYLAIVVLAGLPFLAALFLYYQNTTGSLLPPSGDSVSPVRFGLFPVNENGLQLTPLDELRFVLVRMIMLAEWTSPLLVLGYIAAFAYLAVQRRLSFLDFVFPAYVLAFMLVPFDGGAQYGPRYYFEGFPFLVLTVVSALRPLMQDLSRPRRAGFAVSLVAAHAATCIVAAVVFGMFLRLVVDQRMDVYDQVRAAQLQDAVVVLRSGTSPLRPMWPRDLTRNGISIGGPVIYVCDVPEQLEELRRLWPQRQFYVYTREPNSAKGSLLPLR